MLLASWTDLLVRASLQRSSKDSPRSMRSVIPNNIIENHTSKKYIKNKKKSYHHRLPLYERRRAAHHF